MNTALILTLASLLPLAAPEGTVTLPLEAWNQMQRDLEAAADRAQPEIAVSPISREIDGRFEKGLLSATLRASFEVMSTEAGHIRVPVLDGSASLGEVLLDGRQTSLLREGRMYTVGIDRPGSHEVRLQFFWGEEQDRFTRRLHFRLPPGGSTAVSIFLPEQGIEAELAHGAIRSTRNLGSGTALLGNLDASGDFDLSWKRELSHDRRGEARSEARVNTLFTLDEDLVRGDAFFDFKVLEGEADRFELRLPADIEILEVEGDAVLQWHTDVGTAGGDGSLTVLLRYLVDREARVIVHFQQPVTSLDQAVRLRLPLTAGGTPITGNIGIQGPAGLAAEPAAGITGAKLLGRRDMPPELIDLTTSPLLLAFSFDEPPAVALEISRHEEVEDMVTTIIDEIQASTVMIADGSEITKLKLRVRNNTRQYLSLSLPEGARLTHSLIDGNAVRPARKLEGGALLFPLRQSERLDADRSRYHWVREGETLSDIANYYYSDPGAWGRIIEANPGEIYGPGDISSGQQLRVPLAAQVQESSFVIELAYKLQREPLAPFGRRRVDLPEVDIDVTKVTWHLYFPKALEPLSFGSNLTQYSSIRYDPFRRLRDFLRRALIIDDAWAGGRYRSILKQRKEIYQQEFQRKAGSSVVLASFPLVGERYRFKRQLSGRETPTIAVTYAARGFGQASKWLAFVAAILLTVMVLLRPGDRQRWVIAGIGVLLLLVLAHFFLGLHRRLLWGMDVALLVAWGRLRLPVWWRGLRLRLAEPWLWFSWLRLRNLLAVIGLCAVFGLLINLPLLLSSLAGVVLVIAYVRARQRQEVGHA